MNYLPLVFVGALPVLVSATRQKGALEYPSTAEAVLHQSLLMNLSEVAAFGDITDSLTHRWDSGKNATKASLHHMSRVMAILDPMRKPKNVCYDPRDSICRPGEQIFATTDIWALKNPGKGLAVSFWNGKHKSDSSLRKLNMLGNKVYSFVHSNYASSLVGRDEPLKKDSILVFMFSEPAWPQIAETIIQNPSVFMRSRHNLGTALKTWYKSPNPSRKSDSGSAIAGAKRTEPIEVSLQEFDEAARQLSVKRGGDDAVLPNMRFIFFMHSVPRSVPLMPFVRQALPDAELWGAKELLESNGLDPKLYDIEASVMKRLNPILKHGETIALAVGSKNRVIKPELARILGNDKEKVNRVSSLMLPRFIELKCSFCILIRGGPDLLIIKHSPHGPKPPAIDQEMTANLRITLPVGSSTNIADAIAEFRVPIDELCEQLALK